MEKKYLASLVFFLYYLVKLLFLLLIIFYFSVVSSRTSLVSFAPFLSPSLADFMPKCGQFNPRFAFENTTTIWRQKGKIRFRSGIHHMKN
jgi:hypothetical protein